MFMLYINNDKDLYIRITLGSNEDGKSVIESYTLHPKLADIWRISQYE